MTRLTDREQRGVRHEVCQVESCGKWLGHNALGQLVGIAFDTTVMNGVDVVGCDPPPADLVDDPAVAGRICGPLTKPTSEDVPDGKEGRVL